MTNVSLSLAPPAMNGISNTDSEPETARMNESPMTKRTRDDGTELGLPSSPAFFVELGGID